MKKKYISLPTIRRILRYYRYLEALNKKGISRTSSARLAKQIGVTSSQIRQDLASFGEFGMQGYGYDVPTLMDVLADVLSMKDDLSAIIVGVGRLGRALLESFPFEKYGIHLIAAYDIDPDMVGSSICGVPIYHTDNLPENLAKSAVDIAILTAPAATAHNLTETFSSGGVKGIWNFTNVELRPHNPEITIESVHFFDSLFSLCCRMKHGDFLYPTDI